MSTEKPAVTGYYRCTDILFNWADALPPSYNSEPLRAMFSPKALIYPGHPFRVHTGLKEGEEDGIHTFLGTFPDGKSRHLFSSAQIDYLRYWLHAMQLTPEVLPVLSSKRLFVHSDLSAVSPAVHPTLKALRTELKRIKKAFIKGAGAEASLLAWRTALDHVRTLWTAHTGVWCALDFETWTENHSIVTEFGFSAVHWTEDEQKTDTGHFTVEEHRFHRNGRTYPNGKHVPEYREHYNAEFGTSVEVTKAALESTVGNLISGMHARGPVFLVFHDAHEDIKTLNRLGAPIDGAVDVGQLPPDTIPTQGIYIVDTTVLFGALIGDCKSKKGLRDVCAFLQIPTRYLHNAGNDAHYTLDALQAMASGRPLDA